MRLGPPRIVRSEPEHVARVQPPPLEHEPLEPQPPSESVIAAEKAAAAVNQADRLERDIKAIIDGVKKAAEQLETEGLNLLSDVQQRRAVLQTGADSFLERVARWQTCIREMVKPDAQS